MKYQDVKDTAVIVGAIAAMIAFFGIIFSILIGIPTCGIIFIIEAIKG